MKYAITFLLSIVFFMGMQHAVSAQGVDGADVMGIQTRTGISTLYAQDPLSQSLCLRDGGPGHIFQKGQKRNRCSDVNFHSYSPNGLSIGIEGGKEGVLIDLGSQDELKTRYRYPETVGNGQGFASLTVKNGRALIVEDDKSGKLQPLAESSLLFQPGKGTASAVVKLGHIYLLRMTDRHDKGFEMFAKILVIAHVPNESVTIRWHMISNSEMAKY